jgi:hypothetical protein
MKYGSFSVYGGALGMGKITQDNIVSNLMYWYKSVLGSIIIDRYTAHQTVTMGQFISNKV